MSAEKPTPEQARQLLAYRHLRTHQTLRNHLKTLGLSDEQLESTRFRRQNWPGETFVDWLVVSSGEPWPDQLTTEQHVWCAFLWLHIDNPPDSADTRTAWDLIARYLFQLDKQLIARAGQVQSAKHATDGKIEKGSETKDRVLKMARDLKMKFPRLSKSRAADQIAKSTNAPCKKDQAKHYLDETYNKDQWKYLGDSGSETPN